MDTLISDAEEPEAEEDNGMPSEAEFDSEVDDEELSGLLNDANVSTHNLKAFAEQPRQLRKRKAHTAVSNGVVVPLEGSRNDLGKRVGRIHRGIIVLGEITQFTPKYIQPVQPATQPVASSEPSTASVHQSNVAAFGGASVPIITTTSVDNTVFNVPQSALPPVVQHVLIPNSLPAGFSDSSGVSVSGGEVDVEHSEWAVAYNDSVTLVLNAQKVR